MTLKDLMENFEAGALVRDDSIPKDIIVDITSGGLQKKGAQPPVLCDDTNYAIRLWALAASEYADAQPEGTRFKWIDAPSLDRWQITITDARFTHRLVSDRYVVFSRIATAPPQ